MAVCKPDRGYGLLESLLQIYELVARRFTNILFWH